MKDSGIEWIGEIPADWNITSIGTLFYAKAGGDAKPELYSDIQDEQHPFPVYTNTLEQNRVYAYTSTPVFESNTITVTGRGDVGHAFFRTTPYDAIIRLLSLSPRINLHCPFYAYWIDVVPFFTDNAAIRQLSANQITNYKAITLSINEQQKISTYLDHQCSLIDSVIEKTKASIEEYKKLRQAVITQAVTSKGNKCKLSHIGTLKNGLNYHDTESDKNIKILGVGNFKEYLVLDEIEQFSDLPIDEDISNEYLLQNGDIIFVRSNGSKELVGRSIMVNNIDFPLTYSGFCIRFRNNRTDLAYNKYLLYFFRSYEFREAIKFQCFGTNINNLSQDMISSVKVSLPSIEEQQEITEYLDKKCTEIDSLISKKETFLTELESYKKSMIYEYVTGKKEVPQA